jgi:hypothetical protein
MTRQSTDQWQSGKRPGGLRRYQSPQLVVYGPVEQLTAAGSGPQVESNPGGRCRGNSGTMNNPNFQRC